jgi:polysaccharide biosynthesis protein PslH
VKLLYICHRVPFPPNRGGKIRPFQMIQHLGKRHEVTVASLAHDQQEVEAAGPLRDHCAEVLVEVIPNLKRWTGAALALPMSLPSSAAYFRSWQLIQRVEAAWQRSRFDGVIVHCAFAAQYALSLNGGFRIMDFGDLDSAKWRDYAEHRSLPLSAGYALEAAKLKRFEKLVANSSTWCTFTTRGESEEFKTFGVAKPVTVIPNGVDTKYFHRDSLSSPDSQVLAFLGRMDYYPNIDGIRWFAKEVFLPLRSRLPKVELRIIGSNPVKSVQNLASIPGVSVTGYVPDVRPYLADAAVAVAPLRLARGTQNKILECMGMGLPVVTTPEAARGIQANANEHLLVGATPAEQIEQIAGLVENPERRRMLGTAGRVQAEAAHQWSASMKILDQVVASAASL